MTKILVVEDDDVVATLLRHILERQGYDITRVGDGREAAEQIERADPPHVVILDNMLPFFTGLDLLKLMRRTDGWREVPVIFLSAKTAQDDIAAALDAGANDYVTKPFGVEELGERVRRLVAA